MTGIVYLQNPHSVLRGVSLPVPVAGVCGFYKLAAAGGPESMIQWAGRSSVGAAAQAEVEEKGQRVKWRKRGVCGVHVGGREIIDDTGGCCKENSMEIGWW